MTTTTKADYKKPVAKVFEFALNTDLLSTSRESLTPGDILTDDDFEN